MYSPEEALLKILEDVRGHLRYEAILRIIPAGSVVLGTYVGKPDIDIFIETKSKHGVMRGLQRAYPSGHEKRGELCIWHIPSLYGYPVDFVVIGEGEEKTQTLKHVEYFQRVLNDDMRERVRELKNFFKDINCYGAEVGGITGICITRMAEVFPTTKEALETLCNSLVMTGTFFIDDPVLGGRNLFASVTDLKKRIMVEEIMNFLHNQEHNVRDLGYFLEHYDRIYRIRRRRSMGTDREFQFIYGSVNKSWRATAQRIKWWNPFLDFDILIDERDIYVGASFYPEKLTEPAIERIPISKLTEKAIKELIKRGAKLNPLTDMLEYPRKPPFENVRKEFEKKLYERLSEKYIELERI